MPHAAAGRPLDRRKVARAFADFFPDRAIRNAFAAANDRGVVGEARARVRCGEHAPEAVLERNLACEDFLGLAGTLRAAFVLARKVARYGKPRDAPLIERRVRAPGTARIPGNEDFANRSAAVVVARRDKRGGSSRIDLVAAADQPRELCGRREAVAGAHNVDRESFFASRAWRAVGSDGREHCALGATRAFHPRKHMAVVHRHAAGA